jgi:hypothetical protein
MPGPDVSSIGGIDPFKTQGEEDAAGGGAVTRAEFEALKARVDALEKEEQGEDESGEGEDASIAGPKMPAAPMMKKMAFGGMRPGLK